jgi:hypothetical protein
MFSKKLDKFYDYFKDWALKFSKTFYARIDYVLKVEIIRIIFKVLFIKSNSFFSNFWSQIFQYEQYFSLNLHNYFFFFEQELLN